MLIYIKVKICGIRAVEEASRICSLSLDAIGVIIHSNLNAGPNAVSKDEARKIVDIIRQYSIDSFLLTDENDFETNYRYSGYVGNSHLQLKGDVAIEDILRLKKEMPQVKIVKVIGVTGPEAIGQAIEYGACESVDELLLDSRVGNKRGGTGVTHDWLISQEIVRESRKPVWLAGGLNVNNLKNAVEIVKPYGVDVETGVQNPDGSKNYGLISRFISIAKSF